LEDKPTNDRNLVAQQAKFSSLLDLFLAVLVLVGCEVEDYNFFAFCEHELDEANSSKVIKVGDVVLQEIFSKETITLH